MLLEPSAAERLSRRSWMVAAAIIAVPAGWWLTRDTPLPRPDQGGLGERIQIVLYSDNGQRLRTIEVGRIVKPLNEWKTQLSADAFAVTRRQATEFAFQNRYWDNHRAGLYRCVCCGNAVFRSADKYDSGTGWPTFSAPVDPANVALRPDRSLVFERTEVICRKCDAHLGHLFPDGPAPTYGRYCLNSAALHFIATAS